MITHREKKPHECHFPDCGKSYCDMRSLRRHLESHHSSPPGGTTPGYLPELMLYPELSGEEEGAKNRDIQHYQHQHQHQEQDSRLKIPGEPPRPSSAPLVVPPEPKRIQRTRRSSSGEETHMRLDPAMIREIEQRKHGAAGASGHVFPYRRQREESEEYIKPREKTPPLGISPQSSGIASLPSHLLKTVISSSAAATVGVESGPRYTEMEDRRMADYEKRMLRDLKPTSSIHQEYADQRRSGSPYSYPPRITSSHPPPHHPQHQQQQQQQHPRISSAATQGNMPYLLNIRNPFSLPSPHNAYPGGGGGQPGEDGGGPSKLSKSEIEARHQAVNTYLQMWANGQHNMPPEQLFNIYQQNRGVGAATGGSSGASSNQHHRSSAGPPQQPSTPTDPMAIAVAAAKEPSGGGERQHPSLAYPMREGIYGIHPANAKWQSVSSQLFLPVFLSSCLSYRVAPALHFSNYSNRLFL